MTNSEAYILGKKMGILGRQIYEFDNEILEIMKSDSYDKDYVNALICVVLQKRREFSQLQKEAEKLYIETIDTSEKCVEKVEENRHE